MGKIIDKMNEARSVLSEIMENSGEFTEEHEEWLARYTEDSSEQADWLGHLYRRAKSESDMIDSQIKTLRAEKNKAVRTASWARETMLQLLLTREQLGEGTSVKGAAHLMKTKRLVTPSDESLWPVEFVRESRLSLDTSAIRAKYKNKELPEGFHWEESYTVVMK